MKTILFAVAVAALVGCGGKKGSSACGDAITKGVDTLMAAGQKRMESMPGGMPADIKAKIEESSTKLKAVITNRCTEDKWSAEVIDCYSKAASREDISACRAKLPADQATALRAEELKVMTETMGAMPGGGMPGHPPGGPPTMGGPSSPTMSGTPPTGSSAPPAPGSAAAPGSGH